MLAPRNRVRAGRAIAFGLVSLSLTAVLTRAAGAQFNNHSEQGAEPPPEQDPRGFESEELLSGHGSLMAAPGPGVHGFDTRLYVLLSKHDRIVRLEPSGAMSRFVTLPRRAVADRAALTFDIKGNYGRALLFGGTRGRIGRITASGTVSYLRTVQSSGPRGGRRATRGLECDPYGVFEGRLFLTDDADAIFEVDERGRMERLTERRRPTLGGPGGHAMVVSPGGGLGTFLYLADRTSRRILRIAPDHVPGDAPSVWLDLSALHVAPTDLAISASGPFGTDVMYVLDGDTDRVLGFDAGGSRLGTITTGVKDQASIELPRTGLFRHLMVIVAHDSITIVRPVDTPAYEHHPGPPGDLDDDHDVDEADLLELLGDLGCRGPGCAGDLDGDGRTDGRDVVDLLRTIIEARSR